MGAFSSSRLERLNRIMAGYVERGEVPGVAFLVSRRGETYTGTFGTLTVDGSQPIQRDTIFRIASITKPITAVAAMILVEECRLRLDDPVDQFLPELADRRVLARLDSPLDDTIPANRSITLRDVLTLRLGYGIILGAPEEYPILAAIDEREINGFGAPNPAYPHDTDEWLRRLGSLPLMHQPGEQWMYNTGASVLGALIERASGQTLDTFMHERIFAPLGMRDTAFSVPPDQIDRFPDAYVGEADTGSLKLLDPARNGAWSQPPTFVDGSAGLVSTLDDLHAFGQMMLNLGRYGEERILARPTVQAMTTNQLTPEQRAASPTLPVILGDAGWGLGLSVATHRTGPTSTPGRFGWDGGLGTSWYVEPEEELIGILMSQRAVFFHLFADFWTSVYQAIDD